MVMTTDCHLVRLVVILSGCTVLPVESHNVMLAGIENVKFCLECFINVSFVNYDIYRY